MAYDFEEVGEGVFGAGGCGVLGEDEGGGYADKGDEALGVEGEAEGDGGEEAAEDSGEGLREVADHGDASFVFEVVVLAAVVEHGVVEEGGVGSGDEALSGTEQDFGDEERGEGVGDGVAERAGEAGRAAYDEASPPSPDVGEVSGGDVEGHHGDGVGAFEHEHVGHAESALGVEEDDDGHDQGEPFGDFDEVEGCDVFGECCHGCSCRWIREDTV